MAFLAKGLGNEDKSVILKGRTVHALHKWIWTGNLLAESLLVLSTEPWQLILI